MYTIKIGIIAIICLISIFLFPYIALMVFTLYLVNVNQRCINRANKNRVISFSIVCSIFLALINLTKVPENDLIWYLDHFHRASHYSLTNFMRDSLTAYSIGKWKEPAYSMLIWLFNRVFFNDSALFRIVLTSINYCLLNISIYLFAKKMHFPFWIAVAGIASMCFIPYIFTMSMHLLRQFLCNSLLVFITIRICFYKKRDYLFLCAMPLIHSTGFLFLPILLIPAFQKHPRHAKIWYVGLLISLLSLQLLASYLGSLLSHDSSFSYALNRAAHDTTYDFGGSMGFSKILLVITIFFFSLFIAYKSKYRHIYGIRRMMNLIVFLSIFIILNIRQQELSVRFLFFLFPFTPFIIMLLFSYFRRSQREASLYIIGLFIFFAIYLKIGVWTYKLTDDNIFVSSIISFHEPHGIIL